MYRFLEERMECPRKLTQLLEQCIIYAMSGSSATTKKEERMECIWREK